MSNNIRKPQTLKGFRDFLPNEARKRAYVISVFKNIFESFGFEPLETPALEYQSLLLGKYGEEADKLVYTFDDKGGRAVALRYDQTVPTARVLAQYQMQLGLPFKRYQIQPVWRADKPQKGRYREFLQCDPDIFGSSSSLADTEIIVVSSQILQQLGFKKFQILVNDRSILFAIMNRSQIPENEQLSVIQTLDKLDKKSKTEVIEELKKKRLSEDKIQMIFTAIDEANPSDNLEKIIKYALALGVTKETIIFRPYLARGLDYYTDSIFELLIEGYDVGSVGGGGRYNKLIKQISGVSIPAVGIAFGFDRIVEAIDQFSLWPKDMQQTTVLITIFNQELIYQSIKVAQELRKENIALELYPDESTKLDKQLKYADRKGFQYAIIIGPEENDQNKIKLKNMTTGKQETLSVDEVIKRLYENQSK
ncbi:histidine--tRNA ligase [Candidatus Roizmanbacteria bacterium RIFCSPHIGHO2_02_FULL_37_13b]|uniref:Histidine--tRNA ligase n=1 Tax=Candidatus Roizmanbacteria bacterium RIFCSPLOWO2_02_FULL_36_11 TaxID=1802071 RepID=A0A1F7JD42_9BACT|nr:MAG: histidine--tRNA ligase [Candidatus Roizmanbacteria bacterium RIFCSPHIGHO2_02_FULL_37_13b]OGK53506.1 MAG: histidine--tRNA ligase [Candidatus Roizmanbacteria bacterium RIFCSPLOWO2_02_FULL_36_11]